MEDKKVIAIKNAVKDKVFKDASKEFPVGEHEVDFMVRISGTIKKGEDFEQVVAQKAKPWGLLGLALSKLNGVTVGALVREFVELGEVEQEEIKESADNAVKEIKGTVVGNCSGKVTSKLKVEEVLVKD